MSTPDAPLSEIEELRNLFQAGAADPVRVASEALQRANNNAGQNVYLALDPSWTLAEAAALPQRFPDPAARPLLYGLPVSLKDCFDLAGFSTTCGSRFYAEHYGVAASDSWVAERLRRQGAALTGKTHL